jgi:hypothetical protein
MVGDGSDDWIPGASRAELRFVMMLIASAS